MNVELRKEKLKTIVGHLLTKYELDYHSACHICFKIKPEDVIYIVKNYKEVLESSNVYISRYNKGGDVSLNSDKFKVEVSQRYLYIESKEYEQKNNFKVHEKLNESLEIKIDISCETILTFEFKFGDELRDQISFRND